MRGLNPSRRLPQALKEDKYMVHGRLLAAACQSAEPVERLLSVVRLILCILTDIARRSVDALDTPVTILGQHFLTHREIATHTDTSKTRVYVQELCSFDPDEGPKADVGQQGQPQASLRLAIVPLACAKAKRLGSQLEVKVSLAAPATGPHRVVLHMAAASGRGDGGASAAAALPAAAAAAGLATMPEEYRFTLPDLVLMEPLAPEARLAFKGPLDVSCTATGLAAALTVAKDGSVGGVLEERPPPHNSASAKPLLLGSFSGGWATRVLVSCPDMGLEGVVYDASPGTMGPAGAPMGGAAAGGSGGRGIMRSVRLSRLGPVTLPRLWSALHDSLFYISPDNARGGRPAVQLAKCLPQHMRGLLLEGAATRDVAPAPIVGLPGGGATVAEGDATSDEDVAEFDRTMLATADEAQGTGGDDPRDAPPAYKALHMSGARLRYSLHYNLCVAQAAGGLLTPVLARRVVGDAGTAGTAARGSAAAVAGRRGLAKMQ